VAGGSARPAVAPASGRDRVCAAERPRGGQDALAGLRPEASRHAQLRVLRPQHADDPGCHRDPPWTPRLRPQQHARVQRQSVAPMPLVCGKPAMTPITMLSGWGALMASTLMGSSRRTVSAQTHELRRTLNGYGMRWGRRQGECEHRSPEGCGTAQRCQRCCHARRRSLFAN
jgi:hypothetical protein